MTSVLDLKNPKNRKVNNNHSVSDILSGLPSEALAKEGGLPVELEPEPAPVESLPGIDPVKSAESGAAKQQFDRVDKEETIPNNAGDMAPLATFTRAPSNSFKEDLTGLISWTAPDKHPELISHALRKWIILILTAMAFAALFWQGSILTGITFFALALVTSMHFWREAVHHQYEVHPHGIAVGGEFHHYHDLDSFWIHLRPDGFHELSLCTGRFLNHYLKVSLKDQDPFEIRRALMPYLPEKRHEEGLEDWLRRKLGL